ncbi:MAG: hypothetical protein V1845_03565 [bacterium]
MDKDISAEEIIRFLAMGGVLMASLVAPNIAKEFRFLLKDENYISWKKFSNSRVRQSIRRLRRRGVVNSQIKGGKMIVVLTNKGKQEVLKYNFEGIKLKRQKNWDGKWRVVIFDIPEPKKAARDALRRKFKYLGMYQLQKSVFVFPYACKKEIDFVSGFYDVGNYILYLESQIGDIEDDLKRTFGI